MAASDVRWARTTRRDWCSQLARLVVGSFVLTSPRMASATLAPKPKALLDEADVVVVARLDHIANLRQPGQTVVFEVIEVLREKPAARGLVEAGRPLEVPHEPVPYVVVPVDPDDTERPLLVGLTRGEKGLEVTLRNGVLPIDYQHQLAFAEAGLKIPDRYVAEAEVLQTRRPRDPSAPPVDAEDEASEGIGLTVPELVGGAVLLALVGLAGRQWLQRRRGKKP